MALLKTLVGGIIVALPFAIVYGLGKTAVYFDKRTKNPSFIQIMATGGGALFGLAIFVFFCIMFYKIGSMVL